MAKTVGIGIQDFGKMIENDCFYVDKTGFIKKWWESKDDVTLITRPRRFGKTLTMSMLEYFFSVKHAGRGDLFEGLSIWEEKSPDGEYRYRSLQGTYPVIALSFARVKETSYRYARKKICRIIKELYNQYSFLEDSDKLNEDEKRFCRGVSADMGDDVAVDSLNALSGFLAKHYGKKVLIFLDEYDTPMQEAYVNGYWKEIVAFFRSMFNAAFKTNPWLERAIMTGITRVSKESIFSDLNNLKVVTTTSEKYADSFGFTEEEVFAVLEEYGPSCSSPPSGQPYPGDPDGPGTAAKRGLYLSEDRVRPAVGLCGRGSALPVRTGWELSGLSVRSAYQGGPAPSAGQRQDCDPDLYIPLPLSERPSDAPSCAHRQSGSDHQASCVHHGLFPGSGRRPDGLRRPAVAHGLCHHPV